MPTRPADPGPGRRGSSTSGPSMRGNHLGRSDWRLPNVNELESLVNKQPNLAEWLQAQGFRNLQVDYYWASTTYAALPRYAWSVDIYGGIVAGHDKADAYFVWPVRRGEPGAVPLPQTGQTACHDRSGTVVACAGTGQDGESQAGVAWPSPRFVGNADGTVSDRLTGLAWSREGQAPGPAVCRPGDAQTLRAALQFVEVSQCQQLSGLGGLAPAEPQRARHPGAPRPGRQRRVAEHVGILAGAVRQLLVVERLHVQSLELVERQPARRRRDDVRQGARHQRLAGARRGAMSGPARFAALLLPAAGIAPARRRG